MKNFLQWLITLVVVMTVIIGAERVPSLKKADIFTEQHHRSLVAVTSALTIIGFLLFMGGVIYGSMQGGKPLTAAKSGIRRHSSQRPGSVEKAGAGDLKTSFPLAKPNRPA